MAYIGAPQGGTSAVLLDSISVVNGQAAYAMQKNSVAYKPASELTLQVSLNGLVQQPVNAYTINGSTLTFASNLSTGDVIDYILDREPTSGTVAPPDGSLTSDKFAAGVMRGGTANIRVNSNSLTTNVTIASGEVAGVFGPFTIGSNVTLTVNGSFTVV